MTLGISNDISKEVLKQSKYNILCTFVMMILLITERKVSGEACTPFCNTPSDWINLATNICYDGKEQLPAKFSFNRDCNLHAIRLEHVSGGITSTAGSTPPGRWGANNNPRLNTIIVNPNPKQEIMPDISDTPSGISYELAGFTKNDDVIVFKKKANFSIGDQLEIWNDEVFYQPSWAGNNGGVHCVNVDISCMV